MERSVEETRAVCETRRSPRGTRGRRPEGVRERRGATRRVAVDDASMVARVSDSRVEEVRGAWRRRRVFTDAQKRAAGERVLKMGRASFSRRRGARIGRAYLVAGGRKRGESRRGTGRGDARGRSGHGLAQRDGQLLALSEHLGGDAHLRTARPRTRSRGPRETETRVEPTGNARAADAVARRRCEGA